MNRTISFSFTILCLLSTVFLMGLAFDIEAVKADPTTIYVSDNNTTGPWDGTKEYPYQNTTSGLQHALANDTIFVYSGTYYENVFVNKTVTLIRENRKTTVINGNRVGDVLYVVANNVTVSNFTITGSELGFQTTYGISRALRKVFPSNIRTYFSQTCC